MSKKGWDEVKLFDILELQNGYAFKPADLGETGTPVIRIKQLFDPLVEIDHSEKEIPEKFKIDSGDVIFTWSARIDVAIWDRGEAYLNQHLFKVTSRDESRLLPEFVYMVILDLIPRLTSHGTTMKHVTKAELAKQFIYLPPVEEQREIVRFIQALDQMIQAGDREIACAEQMHGDVLRTLIQKMAEQFEMKPLREVVYFHDNKRKPVKKADRIPGPYPYYGASGVTDYVDGFLFEGLHLLIAEDGENIRSRKLPISFLADGKFWVNNHAHIVKADTDTTTKYVALAVEYSDISAYITGSSRPKITKTACQSIKVPFPPLEEQQKIVEKMQALDGYLESAKRSQEPLKQVRKDVLHALLSGDEDVRELAEMFASYEEVA